WRCGRMRCSPSYAQDTCRRGRCPKKGWPPRRRTVWQRSKRHGAVGPAECPRDSPPLLAPCPGHQADHWPDFGLVRVAAVASGRSPILSLQTAHSTTTTTVVLVPRSGSLPVVLL